MSEFAPLKERPLWSRHDLAIMTGLSLSMIDNLIREGIPCFKEGDLVFFNPHSVTEWIYQRTLKRYGVD